KRLLDGRVRHSLARNEIDNTDLMGAVAAVKDRGEFTAGMNGDIHGEIAQLDLFAGRVQRPLVGKQNRSTRANSREICARGNDYFRQTVRKDHREGVPWSAARNCKRKQTKYKTSLHLDSSFPASECIEGKEHYENLIR